MTDWRISTYRSIVGHHRATCPNCKTLAPRRKLLKTRKMKCRHCGAVIENPCDGMLRWRLPVTTLTIWDSKGRELVCHRVPEDHPLLENQRIGFRCKVVKTDSSKGLAHVYSENNDPVSYSYFYHNATWWMSHVTIHGWSFSFATPKTALLTTEIERLCENHDDIIIEATAHAAALMVQIKKLRRELNSLE